MPGTISAMRIQKHNRDRVNVYLDGAYAFPLPALTAARLRIGQSLNDDQIAALRAEDVLQQAYERALRYLAQRPRSVAEVRDRLAAHPLPAQTVETVIERLQQAGYLDDAAFAHFWVSNREQFRPRAPLALRQELRQKGVSDTTINVALHSLDQASSARRAATAQAQRYRALDHTLFRQKLGNYLLRRGFSHDVVWPLIEQLWRELHDSDAGIED